MGNKAIDLLFEERVKPEEVIPQEIVDAISEIIRRNNEFSTGSYRRVSMKRAVEFVRKELNYNITRTQVEKMVQKLGRRSWAHE